MRTISSDLLAQATKHTSKPYIQVGIADDRFRWSSLRTGDGSRYYVAQCALGSTIWRARVDGSGNVQTAAVTDPATSSQWTTWTTRASGASASSDIAIWADEDWNTLIIFYIKPGYDIAAIASGDNGESWTSEITVTTSLTNKPYITAAGLALFYTDAGTVQILRFPLEGGAWTPGAPWSGLPSATNFYGIAAYYTDNTHIKVLVAADGRLYYGVYNWRADNWTDPVQIAPGGQAAPAAGLTIRYPAILTISETLTIATWLEHYDDGSNAWDNTIACRSRDGCAHWGEDVTLYIWGDVELRTALGYLSSTRIVYAANERCVCAHKTYDASDAAQNLTGLVPIEYRRESDGWRSRVTLTFANLGGAYSAIGQAGAAAECVKPHSAVIVQRGYYISASAHEEQPLDPHYILRAEVRTTPDAHWLVIEAADGWGLLEAWRPTETLAYSGRAIRWLLAEFCAKAGLGYTDDGHADLGTTLATFIVRAETSAAEACRQLLRLAGAVCYWDEDGRMCALSLANHAPTTHLDLEAGVILDGRLRREVGQLTSQSTFGKAHASNLNLGQESMALGMRIHQMYTDYRIASLAHAQDVQSYFWDVGRRTGRNESVTVPLRPDAELWDTAHLLIDPAIVPPGDALRTVVGIEEEYRRAPLRYVSRVRLWGR